MKSVTTYVLIIVIACVFTSIFAFNRGKDIGIEYGVEYTLDTVQKILDFQVMKKDSAITILKLYTSKDTFVYRLSKKTIKSRSLFYYKQ